MPVFVWVLWIALCLQADEVDRIVDEEMQKQHIPGVSVGVMRDGRLIKASSRSAR
jgi:CubicO group peptidase (beta-lactamase class C family)